MRSTMRVMGSIALLGLAASGLLLYPYAQPWIVLAFGVYALLLFFIPAWWLFFIPAVLPVLDLTTWSGWFMVNLFDLMALTTLGVLLLVRPPRRETPLPAVWRILLALLVLSYLVSGWRGFFPLTELDANFFYSYHSSLNSFRLLKGFLTALMFLPWLRMEATDARRMKSLLLSGFLTGLAGVIILVLHERLVFSGLFDFAQRFRIHSSFSAMHIGGASLDAYLVMILPFALMCFERLKLPKLFVGAGFIVLGCYSLVVTFSRIVYFACGLQALVLSLGFLTVLRFRARGVLMSVLILGVAAGAGWAALSGQYISQRFSRIVDDFQYRVQHWSSCLNAMDDGKTWLFGQGLGSFPRDYQSHLRQGEQPARFIFSSVGEGGTVLLEAGNLIYLCRRVQISPQH